MQTTIVKSSRHAGVSDAVLLLPASIKIEHIKSGGDTGGGGCGGCGRRVVGPRAPRRSPAARVVSADGVFKNRFLTVRK